MLEKKLYFFFGKLKIICLILQREKYSDGFYWNYFYYWYWSEF
jgi:hypothetical protein